MDLVLEIALAWIAAAVVVAVLFCLVASGAHVGDGPTRD